MSGFSGVAIGGGMGASVETGEISAGSVTDAKLAANAVTTAKIAALAVSRAKLAADVNQVYDSYSAGTAYSLTNTPTALNFGTTDPQITITVPGTYKISGRVVLDYNAATFSASRQVTLKLCRTNNSPIDLADGTMVVSSQVVTTTSGTFVVAVLPEVTYTTANSDDILTIAASVAVVPEAGSLDAKSASIHAVRVG